MTTARPEPAPPVPARADGPEPARCRCGRPPSATPAPSGAAGTCPPSTAHPAKMLPAIAATAIARYTQPGDLVADPMCGIGTTLVEAIHLGRDALGIEYEPRWAARRRRQHHPRPPPGRHRRRRR